MREAPPLCPRPRALPPRSLIGPWRLRGRGAPARGLACPAPPLRYPRAGAAEGEAAASCPHPPEAPLGHRPCPPSPSRGSSGRLSLLALTLPRLLGGVGPCPPPCDSSGRSSLSALTLSRLLRVIVSARSRPPEAPRVDRACPPSSS